MGAPASEDIDALLAQLDQLVRPPSATPPAQPRPEPPPPVQPAPVEPAPPVRTRHILIVEDSKDYRKGTTSL